MPLAIAVGRRIVLLGFTVVLIIGSVLCATAKSYEWHLGARMVLGLCAGQSEALVPMITQVIFPGALYIFSIGRLLTPAFY